VIDDQSDTAEDQEDKILLTKVDSMLHRHRREQLSLMQNTHSQVGRVVETLADALEQHSSASAKWAEAITKEVSGVNDIPILTDRVTLTLEEWPSQTEVSELLYYAFDAALKEAQINLNPAERLTLIQALGKRLPKNI
jgi:hypothetical protein